MNGLTGNNLGVVGYNSLNGLATGGYSGYNGYGNYGSTGFYGYGGATVEDTTRAKEQMQNSYNIYATQQGLNNKQQAETMGYAQQSQNIASLIRVNRNDDAVNEFEKMVQNIKSTPQYSTYSETEIRALAQAQYQNATGSNLVNDINQNSSSSFVQGLKMGVPIFGWFGESGKSREDMVAQITGTKTSPGDTSAKVFGACLSSAAVVGTGAVGVSALSKVSAAAKAAGKPGLLASLASKIKLPSSVSGAGKVGLIAAGIAAVVGIGAAIVKGFSSEKTA